MLLRITPRKVASSALPRSSLCRSRISPICAFSTTTSTNFRTSPHDFAKPDGKTVTLTTAKESAEVDRKMQERAAQREEQLREARLRLGRQSGDEKRQRAKMADANRQRAEELTMDPEEKRKRNMTKEEKEKSEKEDYQRRYKQLGRNWLKFMVGMPVLLVMSYDLFQRLVMKREQKIPPWKQAKIKKEKEERERLANEGEGTEV